MGTAARGTTLKRSAYTVYIVPYYVNVLYGIGYHQVQCSAQVFFDRGHTAATDQRAGLKYTQ